MTKKHFFEILLFVFVGAVLLGGVTNIFFKKNVTPATSEVLPATQAAPQTVQEDAELASWKTYRSEKYGLEFKYPSEWKFNQQENTETNKFGIAGADLNFYTEGPHVYSDGSLSLNSKLGVSVTPAQYQFVSEGMGDSPRYSGEDERINCSYFKEPWTFLCTQFTLSDGRGITRYYSAVPIEAGGNVSALKSADVQHSTHFYSGISFGMKTLVNFCIWSRQDKDCGPNTQYSMGESDENIKEFVRFTKEKIISGNISLEEKENIRIFDKILSTLKLLD